MCREKVQKCRDKGSTASLSTLLNICHDRALIIAAVLLLVALSFVKRKGEICHDIQNFLPYPFLLPFLLNFSYFL